MLEYPDMKISIGVPAYNQGKYLRIAIESLLCQNQQPAEIIVSNNHSSDETQKVLDGFANKVKVIMPPKHLGMMAHWNFVVSQCQSRWFSLLSCDDIAKPNFVEVLTRGISRSKQAVLVRSGWENIDSAGDVIDKHLILSIKKISSPPRTLYEQLLGPKHSFAAFAAKKDVWEKVGGFPEELNLCGDWGLWIKFAPHGDFIYEHDIIAQYRSGYRPNIEKDRLLQYLSDEATIYTRIIPDTLKALPQINTQRVIRASRSKCKKVIAFASQIAAPEDRANVCSIIEGWAKTAKCETALRKFTSGEKFRFKSGRGIFRKMLRSVYQAIYR